VSYDVSVTLDAGGDEPIHVGDWNYTSNMAGAWREAGAQIHEWEGKRAGDCAAQLADALAVMVRDPARFRAFDAENGWGSYETLVPSLTKLLRILRMAPDAIVSVSR
jgi:hypothetical protein